MSSVLAAFLRTGCSFISGAGRVLVSLVRDVCRSRAALQAENAVLRQQLIVASRRNPHPRFTRIDRVVLGAAAGFVGNLKDCLIIVKPDTVLRWHRSLWRLLWWKRSGRPNGRPPIDADRRALIRKLWRENPLWGENRIAGELLKLGHKVSPRTVAHYRPPGIQRGGGQKWSTFVRNHLHQTWACDWFTIVTARFHVVYAWIILDLGRRTIVDIGVTSTPTTEFAAQRFISAVGDGEAPRFLIHDRDPVYGPELRRRVKNCGTRCLVTPPRSPQANAFAERMIGTVRRDCLDHVVVWDEEHAGRLLREYRGYYHGRPHRGLRMQPPLGARWLPPARPVPASQVRSRPVLGGLHHEYVIETA